MDKDSSLYLSHHARKLEEARRSRAIIIGAMVATMATAMTIAEMQDQSGIDTKTRVELSTIDTCSSTELFISVPDSSVLPPDERCAIGDQMFRIIKP